MAVTELSPRPVLTSSGRPCSASRTRSCVRGRSSPTSGARCRSRRSRTRSSCTAFASSTIVMAASPSVADCSTGRMGAVRFVILGAGAVGGTVGGLLHDAGHEVVLVARGAHAAAMRTDGLRLATPDRVVTAHVEVVDDPTALKLRDDDLLVAATKTQDTTALLDIAARLTVNGTSAGAAPPPLFPATPPRLTVNGPAAAAVLPLFCVQNGVANERIAARRFADVHGVVVMLPAVLLDPGRIEAQGAPYSGLLDVGRWPRGTTDADETLAAAFTASNFLSRATPGVMRWKYAKLLRNLGNAIEALCGHDLDGDDMKVVRDLDGVLRVEAEACLTAAGIDWSSDDEWVARRGDHVQHAPVEGRARSGGSSWQSLARGLRSIEADYLNGEIALLGRQYDVPTPANVALQRLANAAAHRGARPGSTPVRDVVAAIDLEKGDTSA